MAMEEGEEEERRGRIESVCLQANRGTKREGSADETPHASMIWIGSRGLLGGVWSAGPQGMFSVARHGRDTPVSSVRGLQHRARTRRFDLAHGP